MDKKLVLFVDDELNPKKNNVKEEYREILFRMVKALEVNFEVIQAYSLNSALEKIKSQQFDAAVVDILIPVSDDDITSECKKDFCFQLIEDLTKNNIPAIAISNAPDLYASSILGSEYGVNVVNKTISDIPLLISLVVKLIQKHRSRCCSFITEIDKVCMKEFEPKGLGAVFVISSDEYKKDAEEFSGRLGLMNFQVDCWIKDLNASAGGIFCEKTCPRIYGNKVLAANISDLNCNVFFEIGFAFGIGRPVFLMFKKDNEKEPGLKILRNISWNGYNQVEELLESFKSTIYTNKKLLNSNKIYATPDMFKNIHEFDKPEKRIKEGKFLASYDNSLITMYEEIFRDHGIVSDIIPFNLSKYSKNPALVAEKLISSKRILFFPQGDLKNSFSDYRINNAELMFFAGLCVAQGVPIRIITESSSPDFSEISSSPSNIEDIKNFVLRN